MKIKAAVKKVTCKAGLEAKYAATGKPVDVTKLEKCESSFAKTVAKIESKPRMGVSRQGDGADVTNKVDVFVAHLNADFLCKCLDSGTLNPDCSCTCPAGYESIHGGCCKISNTGPDDECFISDCTDWAGSVEGSGNSRVTPTQPCRRVSARPPEQLGPDREREKKSRGD